MTNKWQKVYISDRQQGAGRTSQLDGEASGQVVDTGHHHQTPEMSRRILLQSQLLQQAITTCTNQPTNQPTVAAGPFVCSSVDTVQSATFGLEQQMLLLVLGAKWCVSGLHVPQKMKEPWDSRQAKPRKQHAALYQRVTKVKEMWKRLRILDLLHQM